MECKRLNRMIRDWYVQVQDETLAPARMVEFMQDHAETCDTCFVDPTLAEEMKKIIAIVLPPSKMTKKPKKKLSTAGPTAADLSDIESDDDDDDTDDDTDDDDDEIEVGDDDEEDDDDDDDDIDIPEVPSLEDADLE